MPLKAHKGTITTFAKGTNICIQRLRFRKRWNVQPKTKAGDGARASMLTGTGQASFGFSGYLDSGLATDIMNAEEAPEGTLDAQYGANAADKVAGECVLVDFTCDIDFDRGGRIDCSGQGFYQGALTDPS